MRIHPECADADPSDRSRADVPLREEPDQEEEEGEDDGKKDSDEDDKTDDGYSE